MFWPERWLYFRLVGVGGGEGAGANGACAWEQLLRAYEAEVRDFFVTEYAAMRVVLEPRGEHTKGPAQSVNEDALGRDWEDARSRDGRYSVLSSC